MKRIMAIGVFFELALLIIGLAWIVPITRSKAAPATADGTAAAPSYKVEEANGRAVGFYRSQGFEQVGRTANCGADQSVSRH